MFVVYAKLEAVKLADMEPVNESNTYEVAALVPVIDKTPPLFVIGPRRNKRCPYLLIDGCHRRRALMRKRRKAGLAYVISVAQAAQIRRSGEMWDGDIPDYDHHVIITPMGLCGPPQTYHEAGIRVIQYDGDEES